MIKANDRIRLKKPMGAFKNVGEICRVESVGDGAITFSFGGGLHLGCMSEDELPKYFEIVQNAPTVTKDQINDLMSHSVIKVDDVFDKCTIVSMKLPSGFVIVESSACVSPENYDRELGVNICMKKISDKLWELEGYHLAKEIEHENEQCKSTKYDW